MIEAVTEFTSRAAEKLRKQQSKTSTILVFIHTSKHRSGPQYARSITVPLVRPVSDTKSLLNAALHGLKKIYKPGFDLTKAGIILMDLVNAQTRQAELDFGETVLDSDERLMHAIDEINDRFGRGTIIYGSAGVGSEKKVWTMNQQRRTPSYTTTLGEIPTALT